MKRFTLLFYIIIVCTFVLKTAISTNYQSKFYGDSINVQYYSKSSEKQYEIYIDLDDNELHLFESNNLIKSYSVASGKFDSPSPVGIWKITQKSDWGEGFGGSWMGLNVPWGKYGIHGTSSPWSIGQDASHGCIRMFSESAEELYNIAPVGTIVVISKGPYSPLGKNPRIMKPGDKGSDVYCVQLLLKKSGFYKGNIDGIYGEGLKKSYFKFLESKGCAPHNEITKADLKLMGAFPFE